MRHKQPLDPNEPVASFAGAVVEFDPRHALAPKVWSRHGILHARVLRGQYGRGRSSYLAVSPNTCELDHIAGNFLFRHAGPSHPIDCDGVSRHVTASGGKGPA
jgi:hypothetical protein